MTTVSNSSVGEAMFVRFVLSVVSIAMIAWTVAVGSAVVDPRSPGPDIGLSAGRLATALSASDVQVPSRGPLAVELCDHAVASGYVPLQVNVFGDHTNRALDKFVDVRFGAKLIMGGAFAFVLSVIGIMMLIRHRR